MVVIILTPILFGISNLDMNSSAVPLEMCIALIGVVMLTPIFQSEQNEDIHDLVSSKQMDTSLVYLIRYFYSLVFIIIMIVLFCIYMKFCNSEITLSLMLGTIAEAIFLGSLGLCTSAITKQTTIAYMTPMMYFGLNYGLGNSLGNFYLFSMMNGDYGPKWILFIMSIVICILTFCIIFLQKKYA